MNTVERARSSLRARLRLGLALVVGLLTVLSIGAIVGTNDLGNAMSRILRENYDSVIYCERMKEAIERQDSAALFAASGREDIARPLLVDHRRGFEIALSAEENNVTLPGEQELVHDVRARWTRYAARVDAVLALPVAARQAAYFGELLPQFNAIKASIERILRMNQANMERSDDDARALATQTTRAAVLAALLGLLVAGWLAWWLPRALVGPVDALTETARAIGGGDLEVAIDTPRVAELVPLADAFRRMTESLRAYRASSLGELEAAKERARATVEALADAVVVFDADGRALLANAAAERVFGVRASGVGRPSNMESAAVPAALAEARDRVLASGEPVLPRSLADAARWQGADGERFFAVRAVPLRLANDDRQGAVVVAQDVTRFRRIDDLKTDMVATVSHQFKTPLTALRMATHMLLEPGTGTLGETQRELVTTARDETERLRTMVDELLDLVRIESEAGALRRVAVEPAALLAEAIEAHRGVAREKGVALELASSDGASDSFEVDPERIGIVLANLLSNAIRHTPRGGTVKLSAVRDRDTVRLLVSDTGEGIDPALLPRIFERHVSLGESPGRERHGIGLTIAREIVLQHDGDILATSVPGRGSELAVVLPLSSSSARAQVSTAATPT